VTQRFWCTVQNCFRDGAAGGSFERQLTSRHFIKNYAKREDVGSGVQNFSTHLLGDMYAAVPITTLDVTTLSNENIRRLNVAVHNSQLVRGIQTVGNLGTEVQDLLPKRADGWRCSLSASVRTKLHGDDGPAVFLADVVDGADVRMVIAEAASASRRNRSKAARSRAN